jgi:hypothetical protein
MFIGTMIDITENKRAQVIAAGQMAASMAHEIKQPLATIALGCSAGLRWLAKQPPRLAEVRADLNRIADASDRASQVIEGIRSMFKNDSREKALLDVNEVILEVMALLRSELQNRQIAVQDELSPKLPPVLADAVQLQQVIVNLVTNALEAMDAVNDGARTLRVKSAISKSDGVLITMEDSGPGIDPENVDRIFHPFFTTKSQAWGWVCRFADPLSRPTMGISRHAPPFLEDQSFRFRCRLERLLAPADGVPDVAFRSIAPVSRKSQTGNSVHADNGREQTCRDISIDIRDCPKADTSANCRQPSGEYTLQLCRLP